jgi:hypothetical protein
VHGCVHLNPRTQEAEAGGKCVLQASLGYKVRPCLKNTTTTTTTKNKHYSHGTRLNPDMGHDLGLEPLDWKAPGESLLQTPLASNPSMAQKSPICTLLLESAESQKTKPLCVLLTVVVSDCHLGLLPFPLTKTRKSFKCMLAHISFGLLNNVYLNKEELSLGQSVWISRLKNEHENDMYGEEMATNGSSIGKWIGMRFDSRQRSTWTSTAQSRMWPFYHATGLRVTLPLRNSALLGQSPTLGTTWPSSTKIHSLFGPI